MSRMVLNSCHLAQDQLKWTPNQGNIHWVIPREVNPNFTGQKELLDEMKIKLCPSITGQEQSRKCFAIIGIGGAGKSEVCLNFANTQRNELWGVFWIDATAPSTIQRTYIDAAQRCQPNGSLEIKDFKIAKAFFDNVKYPYLFVLDNADDVKETLHPYLPTGPSATIIITSRDYKKISYGTAGAITLEKLDIEDAIELLFKSSNTSKACRAEKRPDAEAVVQLLAQHALAVVQAGAYIHQRPCTLKEYEVEFRQQKKRPSLLRFRNTEDFSRYGDVYATFEVSAQFLEEFKSTDQAYANALELLGVLGHLYFTRVPQAMFTCARENARDITKKDLHPNDIRSLSPWHVSKLPKSLREVPLDDVSDAVSLSLHDAFGVLRSFAIITIQLETKEISMHLLAHAWARDRLSEADKQGAWACTMSLIALSTCSCIYSPGISYDDRDFLKHLQPNAESCIDVSPEGSFSIYPAIELGRMLAHFAWFFYKMDAHLRCKAQATKLRKEFGSKDSISINSSWIEYIHAMCLIPLDEYNTAQEILEGIVGSDEEVSIADTTKIPFAAKMALAAIYLLKGKNQLAVNFLRGNPNN
ncbi:hypothetical protein VE03_08608 [Pseudogymnoascus sp. 23342-1-I1]|nr:hypothetical protein VE03_08608 [Pseudogymnoascus sp. 23342-1-I1]